MKQKIRIISIIVVMLLTGASQSFAQYRSDSLKLKKSALEYAFPSRDTWNGRKFRAKPELKDRSYISMGYGYSGIFNTKESFGSIYRMSMGTWLAPVHGLEVSVNLHTGGDSKDFTSYNFSYMFNITSYAYRRETPGKFMLVLKTGISAMVRDVVSAGFVSSLKAQYHINSGIGFYIEPEFGVYDNRVGEMYRSSVAGNFAGGIYTGVAFNIGAATRYADYIMKERENEGIGERPFEIALKTNLLYGFGTLTPNLGVEVGMGARTTLELMGSCNWINKSGKPGDNKKLAHWMIQPEFRFYRNKRFAGLYYGAHLIGAAYNIGNNKLPLLFGKDSEMYRYQGYALGAGASLGYQLPLARRLNLEFNFGLGYMRMQHDKWQHPRCGKLLEKDAVRNYIGPTKAGIKLMYIL